MKKLKDLKRVWKIVICLVLIAGLVTGGILLFGGNNAARASGYSLETVTTGDLQKSVTGSGSIQLANTQSVFAPADIAPTSIAVSEGQSVSQGDPLLYIDKASMQTAIAALSEKIAQLDSQIARTDTGTTTNTLTSTIEGRVKQIFANAGDSVQSVVGNHGALLLLSMNGYLHVEIDQGSLAVGDAVQVVQGDASFDGRVASVSDGKALINFTDNGSAVGAQTVVNKDGAPVGSGAAVIDLPMSITATSGTVSKIYVSENQKVYSGTSLVYLTGVPASSEYASLVESRAQCAAQLQSAQQAAASGAILSPVNGIVAKVNASAGQPLTAGSEALSLYTGSDFNMVVSIDELDISSVNVGQEAAIDMDAIENTQYTAIVSNISQVGTSSSGVTTYSVTLSIQGDDQLKSGMNGTATIAIEQAKDALLVPLQALQSSSEGQYVWLYDESIDPNSSEEPGVKTLVTTGLSDSNFAQVLSGLSEGDQVVIVRSGSSSSDTLPMGGMGGMGGLTLDEGIPGGAQPPRQNGSGVGVPPQGN